MYSYCKNLLLVGDFNAQIGETHFGTFLYQHELVNINKKATCYKKFGKPTCIDFILSNSTRNCFKTNTIFTESSDFHKLDCLYEGVHLTLSPRIFSVQVKARAYYITGQWGRNQNKIKET